MAKQSLILGFTKTVVSAPGVSSKGKSLNELPYRADELTYNKQFAAAETLLDNIEFRNRYSIVMKKEKQFYDDIKYVKMGRSPKKWTVSAIEFLPPRMILTIGGVYNGG